jgi:hypothetical protein
VKGSSIHGKPQLTFLMTFFAAGGKAVSKSWLGPSAEASLLLWIRFLTIETDEPPLHLKEALPHLVTFKVRAILVTKPSSNCRALPSSNDKGSDPRSNSHTQHFTIFLTARYRYTSTDMFGIFQALGKAQPYTIDLVPLPSPHIVYSLDQAEEDHTMTSSYIVPFSDSFVLCTHPPWRHIIGLVLAIHGGCRQWQRSRVRDGVDAKHMLVCLVGGSSYQCLFGAWSICMVSAAWSEHLARKDVCASCRLLLICFCYILSCKTGSRYRMSRG